MLKVSSQHLEDERDHGEEVALVSVTYVGKRSLYIDNSLRTQGYWPSYSGFTRGIPEVAFVPDAGLGYFENRSDFEVDYSREGIAEAFLDRNYLSPTVFNAGAGGGSGVRKRVLDHLGIERLETTDAGIREQLAEVAGLDADDVEDADDSLSSELASADGGYTRSELKAAAKDLRDGADDIRLDAGKTELAGWLAALVEDGDMSQTELHDAIGGE